MNFRVDFAEIKIEDLDGKPIQDFHKTIANRIYYSNVQDLDLADKARQINKGNAVDLTLEQLKIVEGLLISPQSGLAVFAKKDIKDYLDEIKLKAEQEHKGLRK